MAGGEGAELKPQATHYIFVTRVLYVYTLLTTTHAHTYTLLCTAYCNIIVFFPDQ